MPTARILVDSSFLIALYDEDSDDYEEARLAADLYFGEFVVPQVALTEVIYLLRRELGMRGALLFLDEFNASRMILQDVDKVDLIRARGIMAEYIDARLDFVDCCIMALSERLKVTQVFTYDERDFSIFRPKHCDYLELLP